MKTMKQLLASILLICLVTLGAVNVNANPPALPGTTLAQGDISIVAFNSNGAGVTGKDNGFSFVTYVDLAVNTEIRFASMGFNSGGSSKDPNNCVFAVIVAWTNTTGGAVKAGSVIRISGQSNTTNTTSIGSIKCGSDVVSAATSASFNLINGGRNIFAYQSTGTSDFGSVGSLTTFAGTGPLLFGIRFQGVGNISGASADWKTSGSTTNSATFSYLPSDLSSLYQVSNLLAKARCGSYTGSTIFSSGTKLADIKAAINDPTNWTCIATSTDGITLPESSYTFPSSNTAPTFTKSTPQSLTVCQNSGATSINSLLTVSDADASQTETWTVLSVIKDGGTLGGFNATASSGSTSITPTGLTYTPPVGFSGLDQFVIQVSDGTATANMFVNVTVTPATLISSQPPSRSAVCPGDGITEPIIATGSNLTYQWQASTDGTNYNNISDGGIYSGTNTATLTISNVTASNSGTKHRCVVTGDCGSSTSLGKTLLVKATHTITASAGAGGSITNAGVTTICDGNDAPVYTITANSGYTIADVLVDGSSVGAVATRNFFTVTADHTISATFAPLNTAPVFAGGATQKLTICGNTDATDISSYLSINDADAGQTETYKVTYTTGSLYGTLTQGGSTVSSGTGVKPTGWTYQPNKGFSGTDAFIVEVSDGNGGKATTEVEITVLGTPFLFVFGDTTGCGSVQLVAGGDGPFSWNGGSTPTAGDNIFSESGTYTVTSTGANTCSSSITKIVTVIPTVTPTVSIVSDASGTILPHTKVTFTATPINEGTPTYEWIKNGRVVGSNSNIYIDSSFANGDDVYVNLTSSAACAIPAATSSNSITMSVFVNSRPFFLTGKQQDLTICHDAPIDFNTYFNLQIIDVDVNQTETFTITRKASHGTFHQGDNLISNGGAAKPDGWYYTPDAGYSGTDTFSIKVEDGAGGVDSTTFNITVLGKPNAGIISGSSSVCGNGSVIQLINTGGDVEGIWSQSNPQSLILLDNNGQFQGANFNNSTGKEVETISYTVINTCADTAVATYPLTVTFNPVPGNISANSDAEICPGSTLKFFIVNGDSTGVWSSLNPDVATIDEKGNATGISEGYAILQHTVSNECGADSTNTLLIIDHVYNPSVTIVEDNNPFIPGSTVNFNSSYGDVGSVSEYDWYKNGVLVSVNELSYTDKGLVNGDSISLVISTSNACQTASKDTSNVVRMIVSCTPTTAIVTVSATGSYIWHGTTYTSSTNTPTFDTTNAAGCDSLTTLHLTIINVPAPTITSFTPTSTCPGTTATVTVFGSNFTGATAVTIGGTPASFFTVDSATTLKVVVPANTTGNLVVTTAGGAVTSAGAFSNTSIVTANAYVANSANGTVSVINTATNTVTKTLTVGSNPYAVTLTPSGSFAYITNGNSSSVSIINTNSNTVTGTIGVGTNPYGIATSPDGTKVYVTNNGSNTVSVINTATNTVTASVTVGANPYGVIVSPDASKAYVVNGTSNTVSVINTATNTVTSTIAVGSHPRRINITPDGTKLYVSNNVSNNVSVINTADNSVVATVAVGPSPLSIAVSLDGAKVYVANSSNASLSVINTATNTVVSTITVGNTPFGISLSPDGTKLFVVNSGSNSVSIISTATNTVTATVPVGNSPISVGNFVANVLSPCASANLWTGTVSTDWFNAGNWTIGVPTAITDGIIPASAANQPVIGSGTAVVDNIIVESGAVITNNATFAVYGNFSDTGRLVSGAGSHVTLLGGSGVISGLDTFINLEIKGDYSVGSKANDKIFVKGRLILTSGTLITNNKLTIISNAFGTGLIEQEGGVLSGKAYIQHYAGGNFGYHHFSSPVSDATVNSWSNAFPIFGPDGAPGWLSNWGSLQYYDEPANTTSLLDSSYYNYTALSNSLTLGQGYTAWLNSLPTLNTFGTPNNGAISIPVTHTAGTNDPRGWNFVGNPYPSPISWTALKAKNSGLFGDASCYLWKASGTGTDGTWTTYDGTVGVNGAGDVINSSLGFFVYVNNSGTLNFDNSVRVYNYTSPEIFGVKSNAAYTLRLSINDAISGTTDEAVAYTSYKEGFSRKMVQPAGANNATIAFVVKGAKTAINVLTSIDSKTELPISILTPKAGTYTLNLSTKNINLPVYLKDNVTGIYTDLKANSTATISTTATETAGRYSLVFASLTTNHLPLTTISVYPNPSKNNIVVNGNHIASVQVVDNLGRVVRTVMLKDAINPTLTLSGLSAGAYHLKVQTTDGKVSNVGLIKE